MGQQSYREQAHVKVQVLDDLAGVAKVASRQFCARASAAIATTGRFTVALSGGSTPKAMFAELSQERDLDWKKVHFYWGDERPVPPTSSDSNYRMAKEALLDHVPIDPAHVYRIRGELPAQEAAAAYEQELRRTFKLGPDALPRFDLMLLGMGDDGHTASLFPQTTGLHEQRRLVIANPVAKLGVDRLTMTYQVINASSWVVVLISGAGKAKMVQQVLGTSPQLEQTPMQGINPLHGELLWLLDAAAATAP